MQWRLMLSILSEEMCKCSCGHRVLNPNTLTVFRVFFLWCQFHQTVSNTSHLSMCNFARDMLCYCTLLTRCLVLVLKPVWINPLCTCVVPMTGPHSFATVFISLSLLKLSFIHSVYLFCERAAGDRLLQITNRIINVNRWLLLYFCSYK